jgi:hypothetical protein
VQRAAAEGGVQHEAVSGLRRGARRGGEGVREEDDWDLGFFLALDGLFLSQFGTNIDTFGKPRKMPNLLGKFGS